MAVRLKVARTARELDDVFQLRYDVYVRERGKFAPADGNEVGERIIDQFDAIPDTVNLVAYDEDNDQAIACLRINKDSEIGLPSEHYFDFSEARERLGAARRGQTPKAGEESAVVLVSGSMLAIRREWRNRRNVIYAMLKTCFGIMHNLGATHVIASISAETASLYSRMGFAMLSDAKWIESVGDDLTPMLAPIEKPLKWAFGDVRDDNIPFWLMNFKFEFERLLLSAGEILFQENDKGEDAYAIDDGWIAISRHTLDRESGKSHEIVLANLHRPALLGELALFDDEPRAATATAITNTELIVIGREQLYGLLYDNPDKMKDIIRHFTHRVRETDDMVIQAHAPHAVRVDFSLIKLWRTAPPDRRHPETRVARVGPAQIALSAQVPEEEVIRILERYHEEGMLDFGKNRIRFYRAPVADWPESEG